jgi:hypothetical protein
MLLQWLGFVFYKDKDGRIKGRGNFITVPVKAGLFGKVSCYLSLFPISWSVKKTAQFQPDDSVNYSILIFSLTC